MTPMRRAALLLALLLLFPVAAWAQGKPSDWLRGAWEGTGYQIDSENTWAMRFEEQDGAYLISYPSFPCSGEWKPVRIRSTTARFRETITSGADVCQETGEVTLLRLNQRQILFLYAYAEPGDFVASAILTKAP